MKTLDNILNKKIKNEIFYKLSSTILKNKKKFNLEIFDKEGNYRSYPNKIFLCNLIDSYAVDIETLDFTRNFVKKVEEENFLKCNIFVYYPPNGIIDWHTNENIPNWNAICTFSLNGNSFFEYKKNKKIIRIQDFEGWSVKVTKWTNTEPLLWHRAVSNTDRITVTFSSENKKQVEEFVKKIT